MKKTYLCLAALFLISNAFATFDVHIKNKCYTEARPIIRNPEKMGQYKVQTLRKNQEILLRDFHYSKVFIGEQYSLILGYPAHCLHNTPLSKKARIDVTLVNGEQWFSCKPQCILTILDND